MAKKVLVIEDDPALQALIGHAFRQEGFEPLLAGNGQVGMALFEMSKPDLVVTDLVMPAKEGISVIMDIRKRSFDIPVIAISAGGSRACGNYLLWAKELGADLAIQKPFRMSFLIRTALELMNTDEYTRLKNRDFIGFYEECDSHYYN